MINILTSKEKLIEAVTKELIACIHKSVVEHGNARMLLSGGTTPGPIYKSLAERLEIINKVTFGLVDERFVSTINEHSNEKLIRKYLYRPEASNNHIKGMVYDAKDKDKNLQMVQEAYAEFIERTDIVILGMGKDGHIASIFPNDPQSIIASSSSESFFNTNSPSHPEERITCSLSLICKAKYLFLIINGKEKWNVLINNQEKLPIHLLRDFRKDLIIFYSEE